jgi:hypothetical protein
MGRVAAETTFALALTTTTTRSGTSLLIVGARIQGLLAPGISIGARVKLASLPPEDRPPITPAPPAFVVEERGHFNGQVSAEPFTEVRLGGSTTSACGSRHLRKRRLPDKVPRSDRQQFERGRQQEWSSGPNDGVHLTLRSTPSSRGFGRDSGITSQNALCCPRGT